MRATSFSVFFLALCAALPGIGLAQPHDSGMGAGARFEIDGPPVAVLATRPDREHTPDLGRSRSTDSMRERRATYDCSAQADIAVSDCDGLVALYNATGGDTWQFRAGWLIDSPCNWFGIECLGLGFGFYRVSLKDNSLTGVIPPEIGDLEHALKLDLSGNYLSGQIPPEIGNLTNLAELYVVGSLLAGPLPKELGKLSNLVNLYLVQGQLDGAIPPELGNLTKLVDLDLSDNQLSGQIPSSLGNLVKLKRMLLSFNQLSGPIPPSLGDLTNLWYLELTVNNLSGDIPGSLGRLASLKGLALSQNHLTGSIPPSLGDLSNLEAISLRNNDLSGTVPLPVARISSFAECALDGNRESLCIPDIPPYQSLSTDDRVCNLPLSPVCEPVVHVDARVLLEGPLKGTNMVGKNTFVSNLPALQPYSDPRFDGTDRDHDNADVVLSPPDSTMDWVLVSLRSSSAKVDEIPGSQRAAFLLQNGMVVDTSGGSLSFPGITPGSYRLVVRHRNHISVLSADTLDLSDGYGSWDFTSSMGRAHSSGGAPMKDLGEGKFGMFACDADASDYVATGDFNLWNTATTSGAAGYEQADCNMDGLVTAPDFNLWNANTTAGAASQVPD